MNKINYCYRLLLVFALISMVNITGLSARKVVKVAVLYEDPVLKEYNGKYMHQVFNTPNYNRDWNNPRELNKEYERALEEVSGNTIDYQIVMEIECDRFFTYLKNDPLKRPLQINEACKLLDEPEWKTLKEIGTSYDYNAMVQHYGFDRMRDNGDIHEVWVWSFPYGGMWESHMMGEGAFWINSQPNENPSCKELLSIMGLNYERDLACAMESYGHRFESTMMQVYGWWKYDEKKELSELTTWEKFCGYLLRYDKFEEGQSHVGNVHFPPNGEYDYDWKNKKQVLTYADEWLKYPKMKFRKARVVDCSEWNCEHIGYMKWWFSHLPHAQGLNKEDGKLNNWWLYVVDYNEAVKYEQSLKK